MLNGRSGVLSAHQMHYAPFVGTWWKYLSCDVFVWLDSVQFSKNGWQNRNKLRTPDGWQWFTVPVSAPFGTPIKDVELRDAQWIGKHQKTLKTLYSRCPEKRRLGDLLDVYDRLDSRGVDRLVDVDIAVDYLTQSLLTHKPAQYRSSRCVNLPDTPDERLIDLCNRFSCSTYLAGPAGLQYMDRQKWQDAGKTVIFADVQTRPYDQVFAGFEPNMSFVDTMLNVSEIERYARSCGVILDIWKVK